MSKLIVTNGLTEPYLTLQKNSNIELDDCVKVLRCPEYNEMGWVYSGNFESYKNFYIDCKKAVGKIGTVVSVGHCFKEENGFRVYIKNDKSQCIFYDLLPWFVLEKVKPETVKIDIHGGHPFIETIEIPKDKLETLKSWKVD